MVLESLINPLKAEKEPWELFFIGAIYSSAAILLSLWIFERYASLVMVFLTTMAAVPLMYNTIKYEEKKDTEIKDETKLLKEHGRALTFFIFLFLGITISCSMWYTFLPVNIIQNLFAIQTHTILEINNRVTGNVYLAQQLNLLSKIFFNNVKVLVFCVIFAFIYGAGAIFILTWNASVIGVAIGNLIRSNITNLPNYLVFAPLAVLRYMIHGIPEILAYFMAGLAGGIISFSLIRKEFGTEKFEHILVDATDLLIFALVLLVIAALIEVFITPLLF